MVRNEVTVDYFKKFGYFVVGSGELLERFIVLISSITVRYFL